MFKRQSALRTELAVFIASMLCVHEAGSQEAENVRALEEIVVTAQKREERLTDVPLSITATTGEQLQRQGITDTTQLTKLVPSFTYQQSAYGTPVLAIRGVGFLENSVTAGPTVTTYVDQVPLPFTVMTRGAILDIERVEVLKGPQGTLFGQNSTGGAINYIAAKPTSDFQAGVDVSYGRFNEAVASGFISGPLTQRVQARLALSTETMDGWQQSMTRPGDTLGRERFYNGRLLVDWQPLDTLDFELSVSGWQDRSDIPAAQLLRVYPQGFLNARTGPIVDSFAANSPLATSLRDADWDPGFDFARDDQFYSASLRGDLELGEGLQLTSISAYSHMTTDRPIDIDGSAVTDFRYTEQTSTLESFSQELRLSGDVGSLKWMVGGNYQRQHADEYQLLTHIGSQHTLDLSNLEPFFGPAGRIYLWPESAYINNQRPIQKSVFANAEFALTDRLTVRAAGRYTDEERRFNGCLADAGGTPTAQFDVIRDAFALLSTALSMTPANIAPGGCLTMNEVTLQPELVRSSLNENNVSWRGGVDWKPASDSLLYATVAKGYKAGGYSVVPAILASQIAPVTQESLLSYEAGFKLSLAARTVQIDGAVFYYDYRDKQLIGNVTSDFGRLPQLVNIPKSRVQGAELEMTLLPIDGLRISGGVSYLDSKVQRNPALPLDPLGQPTSFVGDAFPNTPRWQGVGDAEYSFAVSAALEAFLGGSVTWRTDSNANFGNLPLFEIPGYVLLDLRAGLASADGVWRAQLYGRNVTDKWYWVNVAATADSVVRAPAMPATYGVSLSYRY